MRYSISSRRRQRGFNLIEVSIATAIGVLVLGGVAYLIQGGFSGVAISAEATNISSLIANTKALKDGGGYGSASLLADLRISKGLPSSLADDGTVVKNAWGGAVTVDGTGAGYTVGYGAVPQDACQKLALTVSDGAIISTTINTTTLTGRVTRAQATANCTSAAANTLLFAAAN